MGVKRIKIVIFILLLFAVIFRFIALDRIPIFTDEANHLHIADIVRKDPSYLLTSIKGGTLPGLIIVLSLVENLFGNFFNVLLTGRFLSSLFDVLSAFLTYLIGNAIFNPVVGLIAAILYLVLPLNFFHGRLVMLEPLVALLFLASLYSFILLLKKLSSKPKILNNIRNIIVTTLLLAFSFITKAVVLVSIISFITLPFIYKGNKKKQIPLKKSLKILLMIMLMFLLIILPFIYLSSNFLFHDYALKGFHEQWFIFKTNLFRSYLWIRIYYPLPTIIIALTGIFYGIIERNWKILWLVIWGISIITLDCFFGGKYFYPRHLFPLAFPFVFLFAYACDRLLKTNFLILKFAVFLVLFLAWFSTYNLVFRTKADYLAPEDRLQFFEDWPSGVGLTEIANDLRELSKDQPITVYVGNEALLDWALPNLYNLGQTTIIPINNYVGGETTIDIENQVQRGINSYLILNREPDPPHDFEAELVKSHHKGPDRKILLYRLNKI